MKKVLALAALLSTATFAGAYAQDTSVTAPAPSAMEVNVVNVANDPTTDNGSRLPRTISNPTPEVMEAAQAQVQSDPALMTALQEKNIELSNVVAIETAANGGKTVYVR